jgi:hypothetical protein
VEENGTSRLRPRSARIVRSLIARAVREHPRNVIMQLTEV